MGATNNANKLLLHGTSYEHKESRSFQVIVPKQEFGNQQPESLNTALFVIQSLTGTWMDWTWPNMRLDTRGDGTVPLPKPLIPLEMGILL